MGSMEARIRTLEREAKGTLPLYQVTLADGSTRRMDALDVRLYIDRQGAGVPDLSDIVRIEHIRGNLPNGTAWEDLQKYIEERT